MLAGHVQSAVVAPQHGAVEVAIEDNAELGGKVIDEAAKAFDGGMMLLWVLVLVWLENG